MKGDQTYSTFEIFEHEIIHNSEFLPRLVLGLNRRRHWALLAAAGRCLGTVAGIVTGVAAPLGALQVTDDARLSHLVDSRVAVGCLRHFIESRMVVVLLHRRLCCVLHRASVIVDAIGGVSPRSRRRLHRASL